MGEGGQPGHSIATLVDITQSYNRNAQGLAEENYVAALAAAWISFFP